MDRYDQLLADLGATFRPQREWVERQGLFLILGHFLSGVGAGAWLFSLWFSSRPGLWLGLLTVAASGLAHLCFLGRPERFWRMVRVGSSWISRGFVGLSLFLLSAALYLIAPYRLFLVLSLLGAATILVYKGNVYAASRGIPFWNSPMLPILYIAYGLRGGVAMLLLSLPFSGDSLNPELAGVVELWIAVSAAVFIAFYLAVMANTTLAARRSVGDLLRGRISGPFYLGTVLVGLVIPIGLGALGYVNPLSGTLLALVGLFSLVGDFFAKYTIARAGIYVPLLPAGR